MSNPLSQAIKEGGPYTAEALTERLHGLPLDAVRNALEALTAQGVLERTAREDGTPEYRYVAPDRYLQANMDVVTDPGTGIRKRPR